MSAAIATGEAADPGLAAEESRLAHAAARGDGNAFATLYERYERRAYNLAYRLAGSEDDAADAVQDAFVNVLRRLPKLDGRELAFGSYLFTATRNACYDLMAKRKRAEPSDAIPESAAPIGAAAGGGFGLDPGDPDEDPDRRLLLASQQEEIRAANARLPDRQREVLALRELEELSYDEIAEIMGMNRNSVAQLISRARIKLRDELRGTALASIAASSPDCERALPLIALRDDRQLEDGDDAAWLDAHLSDCHTCRLGVEAMQEAGTSYRAWTPIAAAPFLFRETLAKAAELTGADWSETIAERAPRHDPGAHHPTMPPLYRAATAPARRRRWLWVAGGLGAALVAALAVGVASGGDDDLARPAAETVPPPVTEPATVAEDPAPARKQRKRAKPKRSKPAAATPAATPAPDSPVASPPVAQTAPTSPARPRSRTRRRTATPPRAEQPPARVTPPVTEPEPEQPPVVEEPPVEEPPRDPTPSDPPTDPKSPPTRGANGAAQ